MASASGPGSQTPEVVTAKCSLMMVEGKFVRREFFAKHALPSAVEAPQQERKRLAHMAENDFQFRKARERAAEDEP